MRYAEWPLPSALDGLVKTIWTLDCGGRPDQWLEHAATPDGCVELIRRLQGQSIWGSPQPELFAAGITERTVTLRMTADSRFIAIRLWPWAWEAIGGPLCSTFRNGWLPIEDPALARLLTASDTIADILERSFVAIETPPLGRHILEAHNVGDIAERSGLSHRAVQRWFASHIGMAPRRYLKLLRFQDTLVGISNDDALLADHAAARGYADQAHMARDFREIAGISASAARTAATGPFL